MLVRQNKGTYITEPQNLSPALVQSVQRLGCAVAFTLATETTEAIFDVIQEDDRNIMLGDGSELQIVDSLVDVDVSCLSQFGVFQYAALIKEERVLLVWHDDSDKVLMQASRMEEMLLALVSLSKPRIVLCV